MKLLAKGCCGCQKFTWIDKASGQRLAISITEHSIVPRLAWEGGRWFAGRVSTDLLCSAGGTLWGKDERFSWHKSSILQWSARPAQGGPASEKESLSFTSTKQILATNSVIKNNPQQHLERLFSTQNYFLCSPPSLINLLCPSWLLLADADLLGNFKGNMTD